MPVIRRSVTSGAASRTSGLDDVIPPAVCAFLAIWEEAHKDSRSAARGMERQFATNSDRHLRNGETLQANLACEIMNREILVTKSKECLNCHAA